MDYDKTDIAAVYDSGRSYSPKILQQWLDLLSAYVPKDGVSRIIDLGCGTGRYSEPLSIHFEADVIGIDPSEKMLDEARRKSSRRTVIFKKASCSCRWFFIICRTLSTQRTNAIASCAMEGMSALETAQSMRSRPFPT